MKTNQDMIVNIGNNHTIKIGHLNRIGRLSDIFTIGNIYRLSEGLREVSISEWLRKENVWEFIYEVEIKYGDKMQSVDSTLCILEYKNKSGQIDYSKLIKQFSVIKSQRGGKPENRGVWANLYILLKAGAYLSPKLELEIYEVFINHKILEWRDIGGDNYKELNIAINTLPDRKDKNNHGIFIQVAKQFRKKLEILDSRGYNKEEHNSLIQETRAKWLNNLIFAIDTELIISYKQLIETLEKLK